MLKKLSAVVTIVALFVLWGCHKDVGVLIFDTPPVEPGKQQIIITTERFNGQPVTDYDLSVTGVVSASATLNSQVYTLNNVQTGQYTIRVSKNGFIGTTKVIDVVVPTDPAIDFRYRVSVQLTESNTPTVIDNVTGGVIVVPPTNTGGSGIGSNPITVTIPPGAIPGGGNTSISITPVPIEPGSVPPAGPNGGTGGFVLVCEPEGLVFTQPITVNIPLDVPLALAQSIDYTMIYKTGDVTTGELQFSTNPADEITMVISPDGKTGTVSIPHFSAWQQVGGYNLEIEDSMTEFQQIDASLECGLGTSGTHELIGVYESPYSDLFNIPLSDLTFTIQEPYSFPAIEGFSRVVSARHGVKTYRLYDINSGLLISEFSVPTSPVEIISELTYCHNSGGG
jgi:hypothetical protein